MILTTLVTVAYAEVLIKEAMDLPEKSLLISEGATMYNEWSLSFEEGYSNLIFSNQTVYKSEKSFSWKNTKIPVGYYFYEIASNTGYWASIWAIPTIPPCF